MHVMPAFPGEVTHSLKPSPNCQCRNKALAAGRRISRLFTRLESGSSLLVDGGPILYRVVHRVPLWKNGERPRLEQRVIEGNAELSL